MADLLGDAGAFAIARIQANLDAAEARLNALASELDPAVAARLRRRIAGAQLELDGLRDEKFLILPRQKAPFWRYLLDSTDSEESRGA